MEDTEQEPIIEDNLEDDEDIIPFKYSIAVSRIDFPVDGIVKRLKDEDIYIPKFQRAYVWKPKQASRFVESLLLGLPVPGVFMARERETNKLLVIDGQQRLCSLLYFYDGKFPNGRRPFSFKGVQPQYEGATITSLPKEARRQLDNSVLYATIVEQNATADDDSSVYHIFERLNTGGTLLKAQEIRACIYHGELNDLLHELKNNEYWRVIFGTADKNMRDQELILRFLALYFNCDNYKIPLKEFINNYMGQNRHCNLQSEDKISKAFEDTIEVVYKALGNKAFKPKKALNATVFDAVMVGISRRLEKGAIQNLESLKQRYHNLLSDENFLTVPGQSTSDEKNVRQRLTLATEAFADLE